MDTRLHPVLDLEVGYSLDGDYNVTRVAAKTAWYSSCVIWSRGGAIARSVGASI